MNLRAHIIQDINAITDERLLRQVFKYVQMLKRTPCKAASNRDAVLSFAGTLTDAEATNLRHTLSQEFGQLEGEW